MPTMSGVDLTDAQRQQLRDAIGDRRIKPTAEALGVAQSTLSQVLSGATRPSLDLLERLCAHLGLRCSVETRVVIARSR